MITKFISKLDKKCEPEKVVFFYQSLALCSLNKKENLGGYKVNYPAGGMLGLRRGSAPVAMAMQMSPTIMRKTAANAPMDFSPPLEAKKGFLSLYGRY